MAAYYNEIDPFAAQWLRNLIDAGHIASGEVDERSIEDVTPEDLHGFTQVHLFAGISAWSLALRRAGWPDDRMVWTGSCPCQPFSPAGKKTGFADERHLWPAMQWLIGQRRPVVIFGEQSASFDANDWIDLVQTDMESMGYAFGSVAFPAASVGSPNIRDRAYWVADTNGVQWKGSGDQWAARRHELADGCGTCELANTHGEQCEICHSGSRKNIAAENGRPATELAGYCPISRMVDTNINRLKGRLSGGANSQREAFNGPAGCDGADSWPGPVNGFWHDADWIGCRDGKWRPVKPGVKPLVTGLPGRVGQLRASGNALNVEAATAFITAYMQVSC